MALAWPASTSSTLLSMTSWARWLGRVVSVYMPGRLRTGSSPVRISIAAALYSLLLIDAAAPHSQSRPSLARLVYNEPPEAVLTVILRFPSHQAISEMAKRPEPKTDDSSPDFERSLKELEDIVTRMEKGDLSLEESLREFERGI